MVAGGFVKSTGKVGEHVLDSQKKGQPALPVQELGAMSNLDGLAGAATGQDDDARAGEQIGPRHLAAPTKRLRQIDIVALCVGRDA